MSAATAVPDARSQGVGVALVGAGAVSVQFGGAVAVTLFDDVGAAGAVTLRLVIAMVLLLVGTGVARVLVKSHRGSAARRSRSRSDWATVVAFGVALAAMNLSFYEAIARIPLGPAVSIEMLGPLTLAAVSSRRWLDGLWILVALGGVVTLGLGESHDGAGGLTVPGVAFAALAGLFWAAYIVLSSRTAARFPRTDGLTIAMVVAAALVVPFGIVGAGDALLTGSALWRGAAIAVLSSGLPYSLDLFALRRITPGTFGVLMSLEPAIASVAGLVVIGQVLTLVQWLGLAAVVVACAGVTVFAPTEAGPPTSADDRRDPLDDPAAVEAG